MRKFLSLLMAVMFTMSLWAEVGELYYTFVPQKLSSGNVTDYTKTGNQTVDEMTWTVPGNWNATGALRIGGKSISNVDRTITGQTAMGDAISQIVITHQGVTSDNLKLNSVKVTVASDANFANDVETVTLTSGTDFTYAKSTNGTITFTPANGFWAKDSYYKFDFNVTNSNSSNYAWVLNKIEFYSYEGSEPEPTTMDLYLTLSSDWAGWPAKYAVYYFKSADNADNGWSEFMDEVTGETNMYSTTIPLGYDKIIFVRLDGSATETTWASKWSQTADLDTPTDGKNLFTVTSGGTGNECNGAWSEYVPAKPAEDITFYLVNKQGWEAPKAFVFNATASEEDWPGKAMTKTENTVNGFDVYSYTFKDNFTSIIFNNGAATGTIQTADLAWDATKPYFVPGKVNGEGKFEGTWYASLEAIPAPVYNIAGAFTGWKPYALNVANDKNTATLDVQLPAGEYEFKVVRIEGTDTTWYTKNNGDAGAYGLHREYVGVAGVNEQADNNLKVTADEAGAYLFTWTFANDSVGITFPAKHVLNETWSVDDKTVVAAETQYVDNYAINIKSVYGTTLKENARQFGGFEFSHVIQVRTDGYPSATNLVGAEKSGSTSLVITAKEDVEITMYYNRQVVSGAGTENDNKDIIVVDQAAPTTKLTGAFKIVEILSGNSYLNATKTLSLTKGHVYTVTASGTTLQLSGIRYASDAVKDPEMQIAGAWDIQEENWVVNNMTLAQDKKTATYEVELAKGEYEFKVIKDGAWLTKDNGEAGAFGLHRGYPGVAGIKDDAANNLKVTADVSGAYLFTWTLANDSLNIAFPALPKFCVTGDSALVVDAGLDKAKAWNDEAFMSNADEFVLTGLKADQEYHLQVIVGEAWKGYSNLSEKAAGLKTGGEFGNNIVFKLAEAGDVKVIYKAAEGETPELFKLEGNFYVRIPVLNDLYLVPNKWAQGEAKIAAWTWSKTEAEYVDQWTPFFAPKAEGNDTLTVKLDAAVDSIIFVRFKNDADEAKWDGGEGYIWNTVPKDSVAKESMVYTITDWEQGTWDVYHPITFYVIGGEDIVGEGKYYWKAEDALPCYTDTMTLDLAAGEHKLKVITVDGPWKGFEDMTDTVAGLDVDQDGNICFRLDEAGAVKVIFNATEFKLIGNFYVPVPHYFLVGSMNNWKVGANELIAGNEDTLSVEMTLFGDYNYQFKVVEVIDTDTTWYGLRLGEGQDWAPMVYGNCTGWWLDTKNGENDALNVKLLTTKAGKYTFIYEANENHEISVVIPEPAPAVPETKIAMLDGIFSIAKDAHAQFARGNLQYNYATQTWFTAEKQYDFLGEDPNLHFGDENYVGSIDLFGYSNEKSNYGLLVSNKDADFVGGGEFQDWGNLFEGGEYSSLSTKEWQYLLARKDEANNKLWTIIALTPTANSDDDIYGLVLFPDNWVKPQGLNFTYGFYNLDDDETLAGNTFTLEQWETFEEAGAVFLPMAGSRAGHIGCTNKGKEETTVVNPKVGWYCWVDNIGWYGYYWNSTMSATNDTVADYLIFPGWSEGPTLADEDDIWLAPQVWSREKRRGNSVRLVHKTYDPHYYLAGTMTNWKADSIALLPLDAERVDSLGAVLNLKADSLYELKVVRVQGDETTWFGLNETAAMTYGNSEGWWIYKSEDEVNQANVGLKTTKEAEYPVTLLVKDDHLVLSVAIPAPTPTAAVTGSMNNWEGQIPFELAEDEKTATLFVDNMKSGEYDFRMIIGGQERSNGWWFKRDVLGAAGITGNDENAMKLIADVDGDYTITWFFANDSIHFEFPAPAMFYVTGDSALVKDAAGLEKKDEWKAKAIKAEQDTLVLSLKADQEYKLKLIEDGNWEGGKVYGYDALTQEDKAGLSADNDNNIVFKLNEDGDVKVVYFWEEDTENDEWKMTFKLIGDFYVEPEIPHTYTVVGPSLPNKWDETSTASDMTLVEGVYTYVLADVELKAGAHEYKIVEDHAWDVAFPQDGNASFSVEKDGIYDVTFTLNKETKAYTAVPELKQEIIIAPTAVLMGLAEVEPWTVGESMEVAEGFKTASITKHFVPSKAEGDTLKFKVVINDAWRSNAYLYHRGFVGAAGITMNIEGDDCDMKVVVDVEGDYTFTWTFENDSIGITFPEKPEPVMDDGYYIIGLNGWNVADLTADDMFWSTGIETGEFSLDVTLAAGNQFKVVRVVDDVIQEWYPAEGDNYVVDDHHYGATTVYFRPNYNGNEDWFAGCIYVLPTSTVDIDNLDTNAPAVKILRDGQILIIKGNKTFNIQGQLVK